MAEFMKKLLNVIKFELGNYFKSKSYILSTVILAVILVALTTLPAFISIPGTSSADKKETESTEEEKDQYIIYDKNGVIPDGYLDLYFPESEWKKAESTDEIKSAIDEDKDLKGFAVNDLKNYEFYVENASVQNEEMMIFDEALKNLYIQNEINEKGLNYEEISQIYNTEIESSRNVLGKDGQKNYFYAYILLFITYMAIIMYGQQIAMSVTSEKNTRTMEILVTSTSTNNLILGKVIAGTISTVFQVGIILSSGIIGYKINSGLWNGMLDSFLAIPGNLLTAYAFFGVIGFVFYAFIFASLGALVSKVEELGKTLSTVNIIFIAAFVIGMISLTQPDSVLTLIASYIPFTSPLAMISRIALGSVNITEIVISFIILLISSLITAKIAAKIYRMGTLRYGSPIKLSHALKNLKKAE